MATQSQFPFQIKPQDLQDPQLSRLNRMLNYIWNAIQSFTGDKNANHFLSGMGVYTTVASSTFPPTHTATGEPGQTAIDPSGNFYWAFRNSSGDVQWARIGPGGYSDTF